MNRNVGVSGTHSMAQAFGEGWSFLKVRLEELVSEMLGKECKHQARALWVRNEPLSQEEFFHHLLDIRKRHAR